MRIRPPEPPRARPISRARPAGFRTSQAKAIDVPFEIVVVCGPDDLVIHPGGYRITGQSLQVRRKDNLLVRQLLGVAQQSRHRRPQDQAPTAGQVPGRKRRQPNVLGGSQADLVLGPELADVASSHRRTRSSPAGEGILVMAGRDMRLLEKQLLPQALATSERPAPAGRCDRLRSSWWQAQGQAASAAAGSREGRASSASRGREPRVPLLARPKSEPPAAPAPAPPAAPKLDRAAIAQAEAALDSASRDRARAEARAAAAATSLEAAANQAALDAALRASSRSGFATPRRRSAACPRGAAFSAPNATSSRRK